VRTFVALQRVDPGFRSESILSFRLGLNGARYRTSAGINTFGRTLQTSLGGLPDVTAVGAVTHVPFDRIGNWAGTYIPTTGARATIEPLADYRAISPGYFEALGARLIDGRFFNESDDETREAVVIVDERLAQRVWPGERAIGRQLSVDPDSTGKADRTVTVIGVVRHLRLHSLMEEVREQVYFPWRQIPWSLVTFVVRTSGDPVALVPAVKQAVKQIDPVMPVHDIMPLRDYTVRASATQRFTMTLAATFAVVALLLACVGVYGLVADAVTRRRHEFSVRLALGARPKQIVGLAILSGMKLTVIGLVLGVIGGLSSVRLLRNQLFGVSPHDVTSYVIAIGVLATCALVACWIPGRRAALNSPVDALQTE